jgi:hypothetical protein
MKVRQVPPSEGGVDGLGKLGEGVRPRCRQYAVGMIT